MKNQLFQLFKYIILVSILTSCFTINQGPEPQKSDAPTTYIYSVVGNKLMGVKDDRSSESSEMNELKPITFIDVPPYSNFSTPFIDYEYSEDHQNNPLGHDLRGDATDKLRLYIASSDGNLYKYNIPESKLEWSFNLKGYTSASPIMAKHGTYNALYIGNEAGTFYCLDRYEGTVKWTFSPGNALGGFTNTATYVPGKNYILCGTYTGLVFCVNALTGEEIWQYNTGATIRGRINIVKNDAIIANYEGNLISINIDDKSITWEKKLPAGVYGSPITLEDGPFQNKEYFIALGCQDSKFYFIDALTGETIWSFETQGPIVSSPFYTNGHFFVSSNDGFVYAINRNQNLSWKSELPPYTYTSPLVANRTVYFNTPQGIMGYDYLTGELATQYKNEVLGGEGNYWSSAILTTNTGLANYVYEIIYPGPVNYKIELY